MLQSFWIKLLTAIPFSLLVINQEEKLAIMLLFFVIILDTVLGVWVAFKFRIFISHKLNRISTKVSTYALSLLTFFALSKACPELFGWVLKYFTVFLILTEVISNTEKLSLLGMKFPTKMLSKINQNFKDYYMGTSDEKNNALANILNKKTATRPWFLKE